MQVYYKLFPLTSEDKIKGYTKNVYLGLNAHRPVFKMGVILLRLIILL